MSSDESEGLLFLFLSSNYLSQLEHAEEFEVEYIIAQRINKKKELEYKVRWQG